MKVADKLKELEDMTMLPPIPQSLVPVVVQQDLIKPRPDIQPVKPMQPSEQESSVNLQYDSNQAAVEAAREEQRRRQKRNAQQSSADEAEVQEADAQQASEDRQTRKGLWVDVQV